MGALRRRPLAALTGSFWLSAFVAAFAPSSIGYQDLAAYLARQPGVSERWHDYLIASPFGTVHAATFSFSRPIGTTLSEPIGARTCKAIWPASTEGKKLAPRNGARPNDSTTKARHPARSVLRRERAD